jgi:tetratricopeptide (TPR) repeat protein
MTDEAEFLSDESGENVMLREAMEALRQGDRARARDLLTRLLKTDQKNSTYWLWLSAAVETQKERIYCLQMSLQADPDNAAAKRGLILFGALPPDDSVPPFPVNHPRSWEEKLTIPKEPREKKRGWANPVVRFAVILAISVVVLGGFSIGWPYLNSHRAIPAPNYTPTHRPTFTISPTPTNTPIFRTPTPTFLGPTPLWVFLQSTYTATPLYVMTEHPVTSRSAFEAGLRFLASEDYKNAKVLFEQAISLEPNAPDLYYYLGETYRAQGDYRTARDQYQKAINVDPGFAPAFLGRARTNQVLASNVEVIADLNQACALDSNYAEAFIARGAFLLNDDPKAAEADLKKAIEITPQSALAHLYLANAQLALGQNEEALASAIRANELDMTLVPVYLAMARAYIATDQSAEAVSVLETYTVYEPNDTAAFLQLGNAYNAAGQYEAAVSILTKAISSNRKNAEAYFRRGTAYLKLERPQLAEDDFKLAVIYDPKDFDSYIGLARAYDMQGLPGNAYIQVEQYAYPLAKTDITKAQVYYWEALFLEETGDPTNLLGAKNAWYQLIALPPEAMPSEWRDEAYQHLNITPTFTPTQIMTKTPTFTQTKQPTPTATPTKIPSYTPTASKTP